MGVDYKGLMMGHLNPIDIAKQIKQVYGGDDFNVRFSHVSDGFYWITFSENPTEEQKLQKLLKPWDRTKVVRQLSVFTDGDCAGDYDHLTKEPMTLLSLGRHGHCEDIINALVSTTGGWIMDEAGDQEWHRLEKA